MRKIINRLKNALIPLNQLDLFSYFFLHMPSERAEFEKYVKKHANDHYHLTDKAIKFITNLIKSKGEGFILNKKVKTKNLKKSIEYKLLVLTKVMDIVEYGLPSFFRVYPDKVLKIQKVSQDNFLGLLIGKFKNYKLFLIVKTGKKLKHFRCGSIVLVKQSSFSEYLLFKKLDIKDFIENAALYVLNSEMCNKIIKEILENAYKAISAKAHPVPLKEKFLVKKILSEKIFGKIIEIIKFSRGLISMPILVTTTKQQYVIKETILDKDQLYWGYKINKHLVEKGVPIAKQEDSLSNKCYAQVRGRKFTVFDFTGGREFHFNEFYPELRVLMGKTLAKIHKAGRSRSLKPKFHPEMPWELSNFIGNINTPEVNIKQLNKLKQKIERKRKKFPVEQFFLDNFHFFMKEAKLLAKVLPKFNKFTKGFVFADFYLRNGNLYRGQWVAYCDYDFFHWGIQAYDLSSDVLDRDKPYRLRMDALEQFYTAYVRERKRLGMKPLSKKEIEAIPYLLRMRNLTLHIFGTLYRAEHEKGIDQKFIREHLTRIVKIWKDIIKTNWTSLFNKIKIASL